MKPERERLTELARISRTYLFSGPYFCAAMMLIALAACHQEATVYISHPQVFTRERLMMSRQKELQFLNQQLEQTISTGFQGAIDERVLSAFQQSLTATLSPTPAAASRPSAEIIDLSKQVLPTATTQATATNVQLSSIDHFTDQLAYRDAVNAVIREKELDDTHDLQGHTLYTLKFDSTLLPGSKSKRPVVVIVKLSATRPSDQEMRTIYDGWLPDINDRLLREENALVSRLQKNTLTEDDLYTETLYLGDGVKHFTEYLENSLLPTTLPAEVRETIETFAKSVQDDTAQFVNTTSERQLAILNDQSPEGILKLIRISTGFKLSVDAKYYLHDFKGLLSVDYTKLMDIGGPLETHTQVQPVTCDRAHESLMKWLPTGWKSSQDEFAKLKDILAGQTADDRDLWNL